MYSLSCNIYYEAFKTKKRKKSDLFFILKEFVVDGSDDILLRKQTGIYKRNFRFSALNLQIMATFFGEVLSVSSRAVDEDEDDLSENEEDEQIRKELEEKRYAETWMCVSKLTVFFF